MLGQMAVLRYTEFTSNECLPEIREENMAGLRIEDLDHSIVNAIEGLDELILKMSVGEKAMFFASLDLGCVRALQVHCAYSLTKNVLDGTLALRRGFNGGWKPRAPK